MNKQLITLSLILLCLGAWAQEDSTSSSSHQMSKEVESNYEMKTLFGNKNIKHGAYIGATVMGTQLNKEDALLVGGRISWVMNHKFALGLAGYGLSNNVNFENTREDFDRLDMGYGGIMLEPIIGSRHPIHVSFPVLIGAGGGGFSYDAAVYYDSNDQQWETVRGNSDAFFIAEPGMEIEMNVVKYFRFAVGGSYRYIGGLNLDGLQSDDLNGFSAGVTLKLGIF